MQVKLTKLLLPVLFVAVLSVAKAQESLVVDKSLPVKAEVEAAQAAIDACAAKKVSLHVFLTDKFGNVRLLIVGDGARYDTVDSARRKAYTAAMTGQPTIEFQKALAADPNAHVPPDPAMLFLGGGHPIKLDGEVIGAIGGGGGDPADDALCVQAGVEAIQRYLK